VRKPKKPTLTKAEAARLNGRKGGRPRKVLSDTAPEVPAPELLNPFGLRPRELLFVEAYVGAAGFNATRAYELAGYESRTRGSLRANAARLIARDTVARAVAAKVAERALQLARVMDGDEALERLTLMGRADIGKVLDPDDALAKLPDEVRLTIKAVRPNRYGRVIELHDAMRAAELLAKAAGKLVERHEHRITLEEIVAGVEADGASEPEAVH